MNEPMVILTNEILERGLSANGAWNYDQLRTLGVRIDRGKVYPWRRAMVGKPIELWRVEKFLELKNKHLLRKSRYRDILEKSPSLFDFADAHLNSIAQEG